MRTGQARSWQITETRWDLDFDLALWIRQACHIEITDHPLVPGDLVKGPDADIPDLRSPDSAAEFAEGWQAWWVDLCTVSPLAIPRVQGRERYAPPGSEGLATWPTLQATVSLHSRDAYLWHRDRKRIGVENYHPNLTPTNVVSEVEHFLDRPVANFELEIVALPVADEVIRQVNKNRYLVPEAVYDSSIWPRQLRDLVLEIA